MSAGNAAAAIGLANTNKVVQIGDYVQDVITNAGEAGPSAKDCYMGANCNTAYATNAVGEEIGFLAAGNSGVAAGKSLQWCQAGAAIAVGDDLDVALGVATVNNVDGLYHSYVAVAVDEYFWAAEI